MSEIDEFDMAALRASRDFTELVFARARRDYDGANRNIKQIRASVNKMADELEIESRALSRGETA